MNMDHAEYLPWVIIAFGCFLLSVVLLERKFFGLVKLYWFYKRSLFSYLSSLCLLCGIGLLLLSLLDWRGPEEKIKAGVPTERTIILIDTSASMLAEDVKPSRLQKAALVAKHFARKAAGHQLSIVAFAEIQKKIVPFTNDLDLIDARLDSIKNLRNQNGSSALSVAIQESVQYFKETGEARGNILVLTDGEETADDIRLNLPKEVHLALVGVGTKQGGRIPLDDGRGFRFGYKKNRGQDVITKLNEGFFQKVAADVPSGKYWLANTYSLPSDEILEFFKGEKLKGENQQDMVIKPVMMEWIVVPALLLMILGYFFKFLRIFALMVCLGYVPAQASDEPELTPEIVEKLESLRSGKLNQLEKIKLADDLQKAKANTEALALYEENLPLNKPNTEIPPEAYLNYGTALLEKGEEQKGLAVYDSLASSLNEASPKAQMLKEMMEKNIVNYFKVQEQKKQEKKKQQEQDKKDQDKKQQSGGGGSEQDQSQQQKQGQDQKDQKKNEPKNQEPKDKKNEKGEEKKEDQQTDENKNKDEQQKPPQPKEGEEQKQKPQKKLPAKLKQLMSDDRQLQLKIIEQDTRDMNRRKNRDNKDW